MSMYFCSLASGSSGNCQYIATNETGILLDAGLSGKYIANGLEHINADISKLKGLFITHEHSDHVKSAGILMRKFKLTLYVTQKTFDCIEKSLENTILTRSLLLKKKRIFL